MNFLKRWYFLKYSLSTRFFKKYEGQSRSSRKIQTTCFEYTPFYFEILIFTLLLRNKPHKYRTRNWIFEWRSARGVDMNFMSIHLQIQCWTHVIGELFTSSTFTEFAIIASWATAKNNIDMYDICFWYVDL